MQESEVQALRLADKETFFALLQSMTYRSDNYKNRLISFLREI